jgi:hypothetical protein
MLSNNSGVSKDIITKIKIEDIKIEPEYQSIAPPVINNEFDALKEPINNNRLYISVIINVENVLLDGHNHYRVCIDLQIEPRIEVIHTSLHMKYELPRLATGNLEKIRQAETEDMESQDLGDVF